MTRNELSTSDPNEFDVYCDIDSPAQRLAVVPGSGIPPFFQNRKWELMPRGSSQVIDGAAEDIEARGFCYFELVNSGPSS